MTNPSCAVVVGKFLPPHAGHHSLIDHALATFAEADVIVCDLAGQLPRAERRRRWLAEIHPRAHVHVVPDICGWHGTQPCEPGCSPRWAEHLRSAGLGPWQAVVGSAPYVVPFAAALSAEPVGVDRTVIPVSGTAVREDLGANWGYLHPIVRAGLTRRVVILGAESTGTTTLARHLAASLGVPWVPEYGREHSERLARQHGSIWDVRWESSDFDAIADGQQQLEVNTIGSWVADAAASKPGPLGPILVCDTDVLATAIWHKRYRGDAPDDLIARARAHAPLLYVLTTPAGVPFEQDGLRDGEHLRDEMTTWFREALQAQPVPWIEVSGSPAERVSLITKELASVVASNPLMRSVD